MNIKKRLKILKWFLEFVLLLIIAFMVYQIFIDISAKVFHWKSVLCGIIILIGGNIFISLYMRYKEKRIYLNCGIEDVDKMTGIEFEIFLKYHLKQMGYKVQMTAVTGDYGADLVLKKHGEKIIIQAKRYHSKVGIKAVQEIVGALRYYEADWGYVITNNYFTANAIRLANANDIELWDRDMIIEVFTGEEIDDHIRSLNQRMFENIEFQTCPKCGNRLLLRKGKYGKFIGCSGYPNCRYTKEYENDSI